MRWLYSIKTDTVEYYCTLCRCCLANLGAVERHLKTDQHASNCRSRNIEMPASFYFGNLRPYLLCNRLTNAELNALLGKQAPYYSILLLNGKLYCTLCHEYVPLSNVVDHDNSKHSEVEVEEEEEAVTTEDSSQSEQLSSSSSMSP